MNRRWFVPAVIVLAVVLVGGGVAYSEAKKTDDKTAAKSKIRSLEDTFFSRLAKQLGVSDAKLHDAIQKAGGATIDDALKQGLLTKEQAAFLKGRLSSEGLDFDLELGHFGKHKFGKGGIGHSFGHGRFGGLDALMANDKARAAIANALAKKLGTTATGLAKSLGEDKELEELAAAKKLSEQDLGAAVAAAAKPYVDALVKAGTIDKAAGADLLARLAHGDALGKVAKLALFGSK